MAGTQGEQNVPQAGDVLDGRYRLDSQLGAGGFGTVWQGRDLRMNRDVAVKTGVPDTVEDARRFVREAELAGSLAHPNIVTVHDFAHIHWEGRELVYLVMELVRGESLGEVLRRGLPDFHDSVLWAGRICSALEAAHSAGIVHRDIKPANVIIGTADTLKVLDFGIARHQLSRTDLTGNGVIGTALYMAPERFRGAVDARSDLYSLGCLLMELWTGRLPFPGTSWQELYAQHMGAPPPCPARSPLALRHRRPARPRPPGQGRDRSATPRGRCRATPDIAGAGGRARRTAAEHAAAAPRVHAHGPRRGCGARACRAASSTGPDHGAAR